MITDAGSADGSGPTGGDRTNISADAARHQRRWRELAPAWKLPASDDYPVRPLPQQEVQCCRTEASSPVPQLRRLGPSPESILTPGRRQATGVRAVVGSDRADRHILNGQPARRLVAARARLWHGDFATYWRAPPGYTGRLPDVAASGCAPWRRNNRLDGVPTPVSLKVATPSLVATLRQRVRKSSALGAYLEPRHRRPRSHMTLMQLDSAIDNDQPRLQTNVP
ncbi:MAG: hypothetical protein IPO43_09415 [Rhodoferax sp.]|nr:hypothetical protein [Rhodoferax sp.]